MNTTKLVSGGRPIGRLLFSDRIRTQTTLTSRRRIWTSRCGLYRVVHSRILVGRRGPKHGRLPDIYYAQRLDAAAGVWDILGRHRKLLPAMADCSTDARRRDQADPSPNGKGTNR